MRGVGLTFSRPFAWQVLPMAYQRALQVVSAERVGQLASALREATLCLQDLSIVHETKGAGLRVQHDHLDRLGDCLTCLATTTDGKNERTLQAVGCGVGVATPQSAADGYLYGKSMQVPPSGAAAAPPSAADSDRIVRGVWEVKHSTDSPEESLRQAFSESTNIALAHVRAGVPAREVCVPIVSSNGRLIQFAVCTMLPPAFPYLVPVTKALDLCDDADRSAAATQLGIIEGMCKTRPTASAPPPHRLPVSLTPFGLSRSDFHLKPSRAVFLSRASLDQSLVHMFSVMELLWRSSDATRASVLFPITFRCGHADGDDALVFEQLSSHRIGLPADARTRARLLEHIQSALHGFHQSGVVHMDFYPSNLMWKLSDADGSIDLQVIDWDAAHRVNEPLSEPVRQRLASTWRAQVLGGPILEARPELDTVLLRVLQDSESDVGLQSAIKTELDESFQQACQRYVLARDLARLNMASSAPSASAASSSPTDTAAP
jgi:hypothetical protein